MKVAGIIAEYNPFHNGHAYHIEEVRKKTGADYIIVIMSGNFVQRGGPSIVDKYTRAKMALLGGADLVIELPVVAATASAETFARTGVAILNATGVVTHLGFGCETDDLETFQALADLFIDEPAEYQERLSSYLKEGLSYPAARAKAAGEFFKKTGNCHFATNCDANHNTRINDCVDVKKIAPFYNKETIEDVLNNPNNILAIEYLKALKQIGSDIEPCPILRQGNRYHDAHLTGTFSSATAIRKKIAEFDIYETDMSLYNMMVPEGIDENPDEEYKLFSHFLENQIPQPCVEVLTNAFKTTRPIFEDDFSSLLQYKLCLEQNCFSDYGDVKDELANRIQNLQEEFFSFSSFIDEVKTKNMTYTSISRGLLHILLDIKKSDMKCLADLDFTPYIRILGFRKSSAPLLNRLKQSTVPIVAQIAKDKKNLSDSAQKLLQLDISSAHIYNVIKNNKSGSGICKNEYRTPLVYV